MAFRLPEIAKVCVCFVCLFFYHPFICYQSKTTTKNEWWKKLDNLKVFLRHLWTRMMIMMPLPIFVIWIFFFFWFCFLKWMPRKHLFYVINILFLRPPIKLLIWFSFFVCLKKWPKKKYRLFKHYQHHHQGVVHTWHEKKIRTFWRFERFKDSNVTASYLFFCLLIKYLLIWFDFFLLI